MKNTIARVASLHILNVWYDRLVEPKRFLVFLIAVAIPMPFLLSFHDIPDVLMYPALCHGILILWWFLTRVFSS